MALVNYLFLFVLSKTYSVLWEGRQPFKVGF